MRRTTPAHLRADIDHPEDHTERLDRGVIVRDDQSYYDEYGLVERVGYDLVETQIGRYIDIVHDVQTEDAHHADYAWAIPPASMSWTWSTEQQNNDVEFIRATIRSHLSLVNFQIHVVSRSQVLVSTTYQYENEIEEIDV